MPYSSSSSAAAAGAAAAGHAIIQCSHVPCGAAAIPGDRHARFRVRKLRVAVLAVLVLGAYSRTLPSFGLAGWSLMVVLTATESRTKERSLTCNSSGSGVGGAR